MLGTKIQTSSPTCWWTVNKSPEKQIQEMGDHWIISIMVQVSQNAPQHTKHKPPSEIGARDITWNLWGQAERFTPIPHTINVWNIYGPTFTNKKSIASWICIRCFQKVKHSCHCWGLSPLLRCWQKTGAASTVPYSSRWLRSIYSTLSCSNRWAGIKTPRFWKRDEN